MSATSRSPAEMLDTSTVDRAQVGIGPSLRYPDVDRRPVADASAGRRDEGRDRALGGGRGASR